MNEALAGMAAPVRYVWDKKYVRPYESPWSVMRNFTLLNACCGNLRATLSLLDIGSKNSHRKTYFDSMLLTYLNISIDEKDLKRTMKALLPRDYLRQFDPIRDIIKNSPSIMSRKLRYCPICMKSGYHSVLHQIGGKQHCFIHRNVSLVTFWDGEYVLGHHDEYRPVTDDEKSRKAYSTRRIRGTLVDLYSQDTFILPSEWENLTIPQHPFNPHLVSEGMRDIFIIDGLSCSSYVENQAGMYILCDEEDLKNHLIYSSVYDSDDDKKVLKNLAEEAFPQKDPDHPDEDQSEALDIISYIVCRFVRNLFTGCTMDELKLKEFDMFLSREYDPHESIGNNIVFTCLITRARWAHMALSRQYYSYRYMIDLIGTGCFSIAPRYAECQNVLNRFGIMCTMAILDDYCSRIYRIYKEETERCVRISLNEHRVLRKPAYVIEKEPDGRVNLYLF